MDGGQGAVVTGVHCLQHVQCLSGTDLTDDDAVGPHAEGIAQEFTDGHFAFSLGIRRATFQTYHVVLLDLEFDGVLDGDDPLVSLNE